MNKLHCIILMLLLPLAISAQSISPLCRTCGKKIAQCPYKGKHPASPGPSRQQTHGSRPARRPSAQHSGSGSQHAQGSASQYVTNRRFDDGTPKAGSYTGYIKNGMRNGEGTFRCDNGNIAKGVWENDNMTGYGSVTTPNGAKYEGYLKDNNFSGYGTYTYFNDVKYTGHWEDDKKDGYGIITFKDGTQYRCQWKDDKENGYCVMLIDGGMIIGQFTDGVLNGHGIVIQTDGTPAYKRWKDNECVETLDLTATSRPDTYSYKYTYSDGTYVEGNLKDGKGLCKFTNGDVYEGEWKDSRQQGFGIYRFSSGDIYAGQWDNGMKNGTGIYFFKSTNDAYGGSWKDNKKCNTGTYFYYRSGNAYIGQWDNDKMNGTGTMYYKDHCTRARWHNDNIAEVL